MDSGSTQSTGSRKRKPVIVWSEILSAFPDIDDKQTVEDKLNKVGESPMDFVNKNQHHDIKHLFVNMQELLDGK